MKQKTHRVFVSYARKDGEAFARALRETLEGEGDTTSCSPSP
jgi:hypothetical protein